MQIKALKYDNALTVIAAQSYNVDGALELCWSHKISPLLLGIQMVQLLWRAAQLFLKNLTSNYTSDIILLDINGELVHTGIYIWLFMAALCIIAQT